MSQCDIGPYLSMIDFHIETILVNQDRWPRLIFILRQYLSQCDLPPWLSMIDPKINMVDCTYFSYWDNQCRNANLDHVWPCLSIIYFHIKTIFVIMQHLTMVDHDWFSYWDNVSHNVSMIDHGWFSSWPWLTMNNHDWLWLTMIDFNIETIFVTMRRQTMLDHGWTLRLINLSVWYYKPKRIIKQMD